MVSLDTARKTTTLVWSRVETMEVASTVIFCFTLVLTGGTSEK